MLKSAQEHLFGAYHFGVVSLRGAFYLLIVPLPHRRICKGAATGVVAPFWAFFAPCTTQGPKKTPFLLPAQRRARKRPTFCFLRNAGPEKDPFFASCTTQGPKKTPFCFLRNAGLRKTPFFAPYVAQEAKKISFPAAGRRFTKPEIGFVISRHRFRATPCPRDSAPSVHSHFHAYFCRSFG